MGFEHRRLRLRILLILVRLVRIASQGILLAPVSLYVLGFAVSLSIRVIIVSASYRFYHLAKILTP